VERLLPGGSQQIRAHIAGNDRFEVYRTPIPVEEWAKAIEQREVSTAGRPSVEGAHGLLFSFRGDSACDGNYQVSVHWDPADPLTAMLNGNCED